MRNQRININTKEYWDRQPDNNSYSFLDLIAKKREFTDTIIEDIKLKNKEEVWLLDIGCSNGTFLKVIETELLTKFPNLKLKLFGIDISTNLINKAKKILPNATFYDCSVEDYISNNKQIVFDYIISNHTLEHIENVYEVIRFFLDRCEIMIIEVPYDKYIDSLEHINYFDSNSFNQFKEVRQIIFDDYSNDWKTLIVIFDCNKGDLNNN